MDCALGGDDWTTVMLAAGHYDNVPLTAALPWHVRLRAEAAEAGAKGTVLWKKLFSFPEVLRKLFSDCFFVILQHVFSLEQKWFPENF